ncbi:hypothetical protein [Acidisphaera rubrifaciens]|uniref:hypothetical protein n=1 Tax=Acidisphaera rubrifaciens TaxID=50715 RepID=UPI0011DCED7E|nr:hypothetical protein [Acidisphaera rubrifaciens]
MGWPVPDELLKRSGDLEWFKEAAARQYGENESWHSVWTFAEMPDTGDLVWFRDTQGRYYLAEILGPWEYAYEDRAAIDADIVNFRPARIIDVGIADAVPGKIIACFRPPRTFQAIRAPDMLKFSMHLAGLSDISDEVLDIFDFLNDNDIENVIFMYLQTTGWYVFPNTRLPTTAHYEFVLANRETGERAIVQVKSGCQPIDASQYAGEEKAFLFAASESYGSSIPDNAVIITRADLLRFMRESRHLLPRAVSTWINIAGLPPA